MMWVGLIFISWSRQQSPSQSMHSSSGPCCLCRVLAGVCAVAAASKWCHIGSGICPKNKSCSKGLRSYCSEWFEEVNLENRGTKTAKWWMRKSKLNIKVCLERWEEPQRSPELPKHTQRNHQIYWWLSKERTRMQSSPKALEVGSLNHTMLTNIVIQEIRKKLVEALGGQVWKSLQIQGRQKAGCSPNTLCERSWEGFWGPMRRCKKTFVWWCWRGKAFSVTAVGWSSSVSLQKLFCPYNNT